jgi:tetratricopeptide (TPR) repeat protein
MRLGKFQQGIQTVLNRIKSASGDVARFCFEGSVDPLRGKPAHHLLMAIAIFPKSPIREALAYVAGYQDPITLEEGLVQLQRLSLVTQYGTRYSLLPLTREYALAELARYSTFRKEARDRWVGWYQDFAQRYGGRTIYKQEWHIDYDHVEEEWENIQEVLNWCITQERYNDVKSLWDNIRSFTNIYGYWHIRLMCSDWLVQAAGRRGDLSIVMERLSEKGRVLHKMGRLDEALSFFKEAWTFRKYSDNPVQIVKLAGRIAETLLLQNKYDESIEWINEAEAIIETQLSEESKRREKHFTGYRRALVCYQTKDYEKAEEYLQVTIKEALALQWQRSAMFSQELLTEVKIAQGKLDEAKLSAESGLATAIRNKDKRLIAYYKRALALLAKKLDDDKALKYWVSDAIKDFERLGAIHEADEVKALLTANKMGCS